MTSRLRIGYVPLSDAALLHVAKRQNFAAARGLDIELAAEPSWANIRDKLLAGHIDAAHLLAPAAIAVSLGIGHIKSELLAPVALGLNGNAITVSKALHAALMGEAGGTLADPRTSAEALARVIAKRREAGEPPPSFGHVFPFSMHHYQLLLWMRAGAIDPNEDVRLAVVPPPYMVEALRKGSIDGFCVGAPWNSLAQAAGAGVVLHHGTEIVQNCPEKVLAFRAGWAHDHENDVRALAGAIGEAARWAGAAQNRPSLIKILTSVAGESVSEEAIATVLDGPPGTRFGGLRLDEAAIEASPKHALWLLAQMAAAGQCTYSEQLAAAAAAVYAPHLGPAIASHADAPMIFDGPPYTPDDLPSFIAGLSASRRPT